MKVLSRSIELKLKQIKKNVCYNISHIPNSRVKNTFQMYIEYVFEFNNLIENFF